MINLKCEHNPLYINESSCSLKALNRTTKIVDGYFNSFKETPGFVACQFLPLLNSIDFKIFKFKNYLCCNILNLGKNRSFTETIVNPWVVCETGWYSGKILWNWSKRWQQLFYESYLRQFEKPYQFEAKMSDTASKKMNFDSSRYFNYF